MSETTQGKTPLECLARRLADDLLVEHYGFEQLRDLNDERQRAVASDQILGTVDAIATNLREAADHATRFVELVGPNGKTMPAPGRPEEVQAMNDLDRELVGFFRAAGSTLDCLAGATVGILRLPESMQRADGGALGRIATLASGAAGDQSACWSRTSDAFEQVRSEDPEGWFEWTLEMRNAVIHRARQLRTWLPRPSARVPRSSQIVIPTNQPMARLMRYEPHLRRKPWLPDIQALSSPGSASENWLAEPASASVQTILDRVGRMVECITRTLLMTWNEVASGSRALPAPVSLWGIGHTSPPSRVALAERFGGFDPAYPVPPLTSIVMNPRDARRAQIAERLRQPQ